jgi:Protein of unknown function (DUF4058)
MPVHDWSKVDAGTFHAFHTLWIGKLMEALNQGVLPPGYYAMAEQVVSVEAKRQADVLAFRAPGRSRRLASGGLQVTESRPEVGVRMRPQASPRPLKAAGRRRVSVRHTSGHQLVAVIEIVSPANKDRREHVREFVDKVVEMLESSVHVLLLDLLPPTAAARFGMHGAVWARFDRTKYQPPSSEPLMLASYRWDGDVPEAFLQPLAVGHELIDMPLFLSRERYVNVPLEATYRGAFGAMPDFWRETLNRAGQNGEDG